ncbi:MAG: aminotransferase class I/II-fold pyridoxal phosphate-dependent enzyme [Actinomycetota bacterium]|nr:aminotransferase class I/II-fold pyridoxal phosphate-dependent enzyme [Actinomycetota bacterium]
MRYDFVSFMDRHDRDAMAVDSIGRPGSFAPDAPQKGFDVIPMWVADMNFPTAPSITRALSERIAHPAFGYFLPTGRYHDAIIDWHAHRNGVQGITPEMIGYENGVLGGLVSALHAFATPGDAVLVHSPTYIGFTHSLEGNGYKIVRSPLIRGTAGIWRLDLDDMDRKLKEHHCHVAILCSPHNPTGRVWSRGELEQAMEVFRDNDVIVISDEIWSDIVLPGYHHIPTQSISEDARMRTVALYAPSKTFNLAGLVGGYHIIQNPYLRDRVMSVSSKTHYNSMNVLSMHALIGAYSQEGADWVDELCQVIAGNVRFACDIIESRFDGVDVSKPEGTYMLFLDCQRFCESHGMSIEQLRKAGWDVGVAWQDGCAFGGSHTIRMNLALPISRVKEAFRRLEEHVFLA